MKTFLLISMMAFVAFFAYSKTGKTSEDSNSRKAVLSFSLPATLDWRQSTEPEFSKEGKLFTLDDESHIKFSTLQIGNENLWGKVSTMDKDQIFKELLDGKKVIHSIAGYKNWTEDTSLKKVSATEIVLEINGSYVDGNTKKYFSEKHYMTPHGFILASLDWTDEANKEIAKKAQNDFQGITFATEIK